MYEVIRRLIFPVVLAILAIGLFVQSKAADKDADRPALVASEPAAPRPVSYTHLTLPTILLV